MTTNLPSEKAIAIHESLFQNEQEIGLLVELFGVSVIKSGENYLINHSEGSVLDAIRQFGAKREREAKNSNQLNVNSIANPVSCQQVEVLTSDGQNFPKLPQKA